MVPEDDWTAPDKKWKQTAAMRPPWRSLTLIELPVEGIADTSITYL